MDYTFDITDAYLVINWKEYYHDKFIGGESFRMKQHRIPLKEVSSLITFLKTNSEEIDRLLRHHREEEKQRLESELSNITSRLRILS